KAKTFSYFLKESGNGLARNGLMALAALGTITVSLLVLGSFYILAANFNHFGQMAKNVIEIKVFLREGFEEYPATYERIMKVDGVKNARFVPKGEGAKNLEKILGNKKNLFFNEGENPLPDSFVVRLDDKANIKHIVARIEQIQGVDEVFYGKNFVEAMLILVKVVGAIGIGLIILMTLAVLYIVVNTIQLTVYARRKEIEIMKLVGATDWFIRWPFILEGAMLGIGGGLLSVLILSKSYHFLFKELTRVASFLPMVTEVKINNGLIGLLLLVGLVFGASGSLLSVKRYLRV
ncbi:MAG TPA: permease-like cell division protein FtsX, partial [Bacillota bacterium]|nr:permease-like cell division protein FtsX [Bacillota bacterium]